MKNKCNVVIECYAINPVLDSTKNFQWLDNQQSMKLENAIPFLEIGNDIKYLIMNIKKIKLPIEDSNLETYLKEYKLEFPFTQDDFIRLAIDLASGLSKVAKVSSWLKNIRYMKDYILAPLLVSSSEIRIGIIILNNLKLELADILESTIYLSSINVINKNCSNSEVECKCNLLTGVLAMKENNLSKEIKLYIMNCRNYIPPVLLKRIPRKIKAISFFKQLSVKAS